MLSIALICGGASSEREISLKSAASIEGALEDIGHRVTRIELMFDSLDGIDLKGFDFAFIAMHGGWGEGGGLQRELEERGIPYSGSDALSSRIALDKELSKQHFAKQRIATPQWEIATRSTPESRLRRIFKRFGFPLAVKPTCEGSSVGVSVPKSSEIALEAIEDALEFGPRVMIERGVKGREFTVAVIGARAYPVIEIATSNEFFDWQAKYESAETRYIEKPELSELQVKQAQYLAKRAHNALRCHGYSRVDLMMDASGDFTVLEVNTLPGMTTRSLLPLATKQAGLSYEETLQAMIDASLAERRRIDESAYTPKYQNA
ncbi:MAG: D-alanine--D-alanine ligase [Planctomycetes bacterium]|nr:D-alanine--D-alanine ligase [Planctomycetota bacterium]